MKPIYRHAFFALLILLNGPVLGADKPNPCAVNLEEFALPVFTWVDQPTIVDIAARYEQSFLKPVIGEKLKSRVGYAMEPVPVAIDRGVYDRTQEAAAQRARAANAFMKDIYSPDPTEGPSLFKTHPKVKWILESNPFYNKDVVGSAMAYDTTEKDEWDFQLAMDWVVRENPDGSLGLSILESDSGSIGGTFRLALIAQAIQKQWGRSKILRDYEDSRIYLWEMYRQLHEKAQRYGEGEVLFYTEADFEKMLRDGTTERNRNPDQPFPSWLTQHNILWASNWNRHQLVFNPTTHCYHFNGKKITGMLLGYYTEALDTASSTFSQLLALFDNDYERSHAIPGFWENYLGGGYQHWYQFSPAGVEIFGDKAISALLPLLVRFYLNEDPILSSSNYELFVGADNSADPNLIRSVSSNKDQWVIKPRAGGQGRGVSIGKKLTSSQWTTLIQQVVKNPLDYIAQPYFEERLMEVPGLSELRAFEVRTITYFMNGVPNVIPAPYIRANLPGHLRNLTPQGTTATIIPVLVPRR